MLKTVRLAAFAQITRQSKDAVHNYQKHGDAPWSDDDFADEAQRRYSGFHALSIILAETLRAQGCSVSFSGQVVRAHAVAINLFLDEVETFQLPTPRFVLAMQNAIEDEWAGAIWRPTILVGLGTLAEVQDAITAALARVGATSATRGDRTTERVIGGPWVATASINEAYRLLCIRAKTAGYVVEGRNILKIAENEAE